MNAPNTVSMMAACAIGDRIGVDWATIPLEEFRLGLAIELEHGTRDPQTNVTNDDPILTGKIALAHLKELPDYYAARRDGSELGRTRDGDR